jgi:hypothetical protein
MGRGLSDRQALLRSAGGVLLALACILALARRSGTGWSDFELMLVVAVPAAFLYVLAVTGPPRAGSDEPWRSVILIVSLLLVPVALLLFLRWAGGSTKHLLYDATILLVSSGLAILGGRRSRTPYAFLLAGLALLGAWMLVWAKIIDQPSAGTVRWLLLAGGLLLALGAGMLSLAGRGTGAQEMGIAGALGMLAAGATGIFVSGFGAIAGPLLASGSSRVVTRTVQASGSTAGPPVRTVVSEQVPAHTYVAHLSGTQSLGWDIFLLALGLLLILAGSRTRSRGLGYVGLLALLFFLGSVGSQIARLFAGHAPSHSLAGWPLVLLGVAIVLLAGSWTRPGARSGGTGSPNRPT